MRVDERLSNGDGVGFGFGRSQSEQDERKKMSKGPGGLCGLSNLGSRFWSGAVQEKGRSEKRDDVA